MELLYKGMSLFGYCGSKVNLTGFPGLVDKLPPEVGELPGPKPTLYGNNTSPPLYTQAKREIVGSDLVALLQEKDSFIKHGAEVKEFGEPRAILVRDEQTRRKLRKEVKDFALVLTILQSKGMEFEDVFLYDFFTTSPYGLDFAVLEEILDGHSMGMFFAND